MWWKLNSSGFYTFESLDLHIAWESYSVTTSSSLEFISPLERLVLFLTSYFFRFQEWCAFYQAERSYHGVRGSTYPSLSPGMNYGILQKFHYYPGTWDGFWKARLEGRAFAPYSEFQFSSVQSLSRSDSLQPHDRSTPGLPVHHQLPEFTEIHVHRVGDAIQPSHPLSSPSPPALNLSQHQGLFKWVNSFHQVAKVLEFRFNISPSNEYLGLISFRMDWLDLLAVQGTLKSLLQHHSSKASILQHSAFFIVQLSHPYMTTGKTIALTRRTFVDKVMSLLFIMLSRLVITFLPRSKHLLISWLQSPSAVILEPRKI